LIILWVTTINLMPLRFNAYRITLLVQNTLFGELQPKETSFRDVLNALIAAKKDTFMVRRSRFILYFIKDLLPEVYLLELAREERQNMPVEGDTKIEEVSVRRAPFVYVILDIKKQIILMQEKKTAFQDNEVSIERLRTYFESKLQQYFIVPSITPISNTATFWEEVKNADGIKEFDITLNAPNLFKGRQKAEELVEEVHEEFNVTEFEIKLKNKLGQLKLLYENAKDFVSLAASGGGKYVLKLIKDGKEVILKSYDFIKKATFEAETPEEISKEQLENELTDLDKLNENPPENK
jgi:hypothetical protein